MYLKETFNPDGFDCMAMALGDAGDKAERGFKGTFLGGGSSSSFSSSSSSSVDIEDLVYIKGMGFKEKDAKQALIDANGDRDLAIQILISASSSEN